MFRTPQSFLRARTALISCVLLTIVVSGWAATIEVTVSDPDGKPVPGATIVVVGAGKEAVTSTAGAARIEGVAAGRYDLSVRAPGFSTRRLEVTAEDKASATVSLTLMASVHFAESVTVGPGARDTFEAYQPTTVLGGMALQEKLRGSLGETLANEVGVNLRSFGPGPGRPVVRGLDNDRVLVVENGARTGDLSSQSGDHAVNLDPASAGQIEIVRGPATLLYGSNALGGVVNIVSDEIPGQPLSGLHGNLTAQGGTGDRSGGVAAGLKGGRGHWSYHANGSFFDSGDVKTPGLDVPNSQANTKAAGAGVSYADANGYLGGAYRYTKQDYGIPFVEEGGTTLDPRRHSVDLRGEKRNMSGVVSGAKVLFSHRDYLHNEREADGAIATTFGNKYTEGQILLNHKPTGRLKGTFGLWGSHRDYTSAGEEALSPATKQDTFAAFLYEEVTWRHVGLQFGLRYDYSGFKPGPVEPDDDAEFVRPAPVRDRSFNNLSTSVGLLGYLTDEVTMALNFTSAARNPSLEELYNLGPHAGNFAFEIGDPNLGTERGNGLDVSLRVRKERVQGELAVFYNRIDNFIFPFQNGAISDDLPVVELIQTESTLKGVEAHLDFRLTKALWLETGGDSVRGEQHPSGDPLPRIPPYRIWGGVRFDRAGWHLEAILKHAGPQDRLYGAETGTEGYTVLNGHVSKSFAAGRATHTFTARLDNATDELYRNHLSYIKDQAPEMGRSLRALYSIRF